MTDTKPVAWHLRCDEYESVTLLKRHADAMAEIYKTKPVPLYYAAALTDAERAAILTAADLLIGSKPGAVLRKLLARLA
jgi:hypothetical protein